MAIPRPIIPDKDLFTIGEACRILQLPHHTLRYWEQKVPSVRPARLGSGHRRYTRHSLETLLRIKELMRDGRMTLAGARRALAGEAGPRRAEAQSGAAGAAQAKLLKELRAELREILVEFSK